MDRARAGGILLGLGILLTVATIFASGLIYGFSRGILSPLFSGGAPMFFIRIGIALTVLGVATRSRWPISIERAVKVAIVALAVMFIISVGVRYFHLMTTAPEIESPRILATIGMHQAAETLVTAPVPAGFVAGVIEKRGRPSTAFRILVGTMVVSWVLTVLVKMAAGPISAFTVGFALVGAVAATYIAVLPRNLVRKLTVTELG